MLCAYCLASTEDGAPMHPDCAEHERAYIKAAQDYISGTSLGWSGLVHNIEIAKERLAKYNEWVKIGAKQE